MVLLFIILQSISLKIKKVHEMLKIVHQISPAKSLIGEA